VEQISYRVGTKSIVLVLLPNLRSGMEEGGRRWRARQLISRLLDLEVTCFNISPHSVNNVLATTLRYFYHDNLYVSERFFFLPSRGTPPRGHLFITAALFCPGEKPNIFL